MENRQLRHAVFDRCLRHIVEVVNDASVSVDPFPHFLIRGFLPDDVYRDLLKHLPPDELYEPFEYARNSKTDGSSTRFRFELSDQVIGKIGEKSQPLWLGVRDALGCRQLKEAVFRRLAVGLARRYAVPASQAADLPGYPMPALFRETAQYRIKPHPDTKKKVVTMQIALAADDSQKHLGTQFYRLHVTPRTLMREPRGFETVKTAPFLPNAAYAFVVLNTLTWKSWHGRTILAASAGVRNSLLNIWNEKADHANPDVVREHYAMPRAA